MQDKLKALHEAEHRKLDVEIAAMEAALAKEVGEGRKEQEAESNDQSASGKDSDLTTSVGEGEKAMAVTTTIIGKPDWGEPDSINKTQEDKEEDNVDNSEETSRETSVATDDKETCQ